MLRLSNAQNVTLQVILSYKGREEYKMFKFEALRHLKDGGLGACILCFMT